MVSIDINSNILSKLQQDSDATKEIAILLKGELVKYSKKIWKKERIKIQKDLLQCLLPTLLEIITKEEEILKYLNLSEVSFAGINVTCKNFKDSNANIDPQLIDSKDLQFTNLCGCNMTGKDFAGVDIRFANLENTNAQIDPQFIKGESLHSTNVKGCTFINLVSPDSPADFTYVNIVNANLENTNAQIDPQSIKDKSLEHTNLKGIDLSHANFNGVYIWGANLERTGAIINPHTVYHSEINYTNLNYCTLIDDGKLQGIKYNQSTSLKHVKFTTLEPQIENIYQDITEYIQTACSPKRNKVFKKNKRYTKQKGEDL